MCAVLSYVKWLHALRWWLNFKITSSEGRDHTRSVRKNPTPKAQPKTAAIKAQWVEPATAKLTSEAHGWTPRGFSSSPPARLGLKIESGQRGCQRVQQGSQKAFYSLFLKGTTKWTMCSTKDSGMLLANKLSKRCTQRRRCIIHKHRWLQTRQRREEEEMSQPGLGERGENQKKFFLYIIHINSVTKSGLTVPPDPITEDRLNKDDESNSKKEN